MKYLILMLLSFNTFAADESPADFLSLCKATLQHKPKSLPLCENIHKKFFIANKTNDIAMLKPSDVNAPASPLDEKIQFFIFNDPNYLSGIAYCYFVHRNWISSGQTGPDALAASASGFSILNEEIPAYKKWLSTSVEGKKCKERVEKEAGVSVADLELSLKGRVALIGLNPYASIQNPDPTEESVLNDMKLTINHERIHAFQVACPNFEKWSIKEWENLATAKKNEYIKKYPSYTWSLPKVAGREYVAFWFENQPEKVAKFIDGCKL